MATARDALHVVQVLRQMCFSNLSGLLGAYHASVLMIYAMARHLRLKQRPEHCECAGRNSLHLLHARCQLLRSALCRMRNVRSQPIGAALECAEGIPAAREPQV